MDDRELLQEFATTRSDQAFARLVDRHADLVYGTCLRRLRDPASADDATQAVFVGLARRAASLPGGVVLAGWLYRAAVYEANHARRAAARRRRHEMSAAEHRLEMTRQPSAANGSPGVDDAAVDRALSRLRSTERVAVVLRYLQGRSLAEVAGEMGMTEDAARKRISRGLDRLRQLLRPAGVAEAGFGVAAVEAVLRAAVHAAPATVKAAATKAAVGTAVGSFVGGVVSDKWGFGLKGLVLHMGMAKTTGLLTAAAIAVLAGGGVVATVRTMRGKAEEVVTVSPTNAAAAAAVVRPNVGRSPPGASRRAADDQPRPIAPGWRTRFDAAYHLNPGEDVRFVPGPPIPERAPVVQDESKADDTAVMSDKYRGTFEFDAGKKNIKTHTYFYGRWSLAMLLAGGLDVHRPALAVESIPASLQIDGDWVFREGITDQQKLDGIAAVISRQLGRPVRFERRPVPQVVIAFTGTYHYTPLAGRTDDGLIHLDSPSTKRNRTTRRLPLSQLLANLGENARLILVNATTEPDLVVRADGDGTDMAGASSLAAMDQLARQAGLRMVREVRQTPMWLMVESDGRPFASDQPLPGGT